MALLNLYDYEAEAQRLLPAHLWDFIAGGAFDEATTRRNRHAFDALLLWPRYLRDVRNRELGTTMLGTTVSLPVFVSPAGRHDLVHPEAEAETARGAGASGALMVVPGLEARIEEVAAAATGPLWLQIYHQNRAATERMVRRAEDAGYLAICLTVDVPVRVLRERDIRNGFLPPYDQVLGSSDGPGPSVETAAPAFPLTWDDVEWVRSSTTLPIVLKGILTAEDARAALEVGVDGIFVSNHGGRQIDHTVSSIEALPEIVETASSRLEVYLDSGVRRGMDALRALALGARAVGIGRPFYWGLAVGGAEGVHRVLEILRFELDTALAYCGLPSVHQLGEEVLRVPVDFGGRRH